MTDINGQIERIDRNTIKELVEAEKKPEYVFIYTDKMIIDKVNEIIDVVNKLQVNYDKTK